MPTIDQVFSDPRTTSRNSATLAERAGVTQAAAAKFLKDQASAQITKRAHKPADEDFAPTGGPRGEYLADIVKFTEYRGVNNKRECILTLLGVNSRYVYARALTKATAAQTAEALDNILLQNKKDARRGVVAPILAIRSDGGPEFAGKFAGLLKKRNIQHQVIQPNTHARLARLDRYHGTLRRQIGATFVARDSHVWFDVLQDLVDNHNESPSRALDPIGRGTSPAEVGEDEEDTMRRFDLNRAAALRQRIDALHIKIGSRVRLLASALKKSDSKFRKAQEATWTSETYGVIARVGANTFQIDAPPGENQIWPVHALQVVDKAVGGAVKPGPKINRAVVAAKRMEARSISEEEQAAALAAPAAKKRVSKPTAKALAAAERPKRAAKRPAKFT